MATNGFWLSIRLDSELSSRCYQRRSWRWSWQISKLGNAGGKPFLIQLRLVFERSSPLTCPCTWCKTTTNNPEFELKSSQGTSMDLFNFLSQAKVYQVSKEQDVPIESTVLARVKDTAGSTEVTVTANTALLESPRSNSSILFTFAQFHPKTPRGYQQSKNKRNARTPPCLRTKSLVRINNQRVFALALRSPHRWSNIHTCPPEHVDLDNVQTSHH